MKMNKILLCMIIILFSITIIECREYRTYDGTNNNLVHPNWGATDQPCQSLTDDFLTFVDGIHEMDTTKPSPRDISLRVLGLPSPLENTKGETLSILHMYIGQAIAHDIILATEKSTEAADITVAPGDPFFDPFGREGLVIPFNRSTSVQVEGKRYKMPLNKVSSYLDGSVWYGSSQERTDLLRDPQDLAKLASWNNARGESMLPLNTIGAPNANPAGFVADEDQFLSGDVRANENPGLTALHVIFHDEHNLIVDELRAENPTASANWLFEEARRLVVAKWQSIVFNEYFSVTLGEPMPTYNGYDESINTNINIAFGSAAFRYGHSEVSSIVSLVDPDTLNPREPLLLRDAYHNPLLWRELGTASVLYPSFFQPQQPVDHALVEDLRNFLFGAPGAGALDLGALNIQRNRDHGTPLFNDYREHVLGLPRYQSFEEITSHLPTVEALKDIYDNNIDAVEFYVGGISEDALIYRDDVDSLSKLGETFGEVVKRQYQALRDGDRFYYGNTQVSGFTSEEVETINSFTLSDLIERNMAELKDKVPCSVLYVSLPGTSYGCGSNATTNGDNSISLINNQMEVSWSIDSIRGTIQFDVRADTTGWVGIGFSRNGAAMLNSDVVIVSVNDATGAVSFDDFDIRQTREFRCPGVCPDTELGGTNDVVLLEASQDAFSTRFSFERLLDTGDFHDVVIDVDRPMDMIVAMSASGSDTPAYHSENKAVASVNLGTGQFNLLAEDDDERQRKVTWHGVLMFVAWAVIFPIGICIPRFGKSLLLRWWFRLHMALQYLGTVILVAALIVIIELVASEGEEHFDNDHAKLGLATVCLAIVTPVLGQATSLLWTNEATNVPWIPHKLHYITGYVSPLFGFATIFLGLHEFDVRWWWYLLVALWIGILMIGFIIGYAYQRFAASDAMAKELPDIAANNDEQNWSSDDD